MSAPKPAIVVCHVFVRGRVQGVFYRKYTQRAALERGVRGWVRNLEDGRVEMMAEGPKENVDSLVEWCRVGSPKSRVDGVEATIVSSGDAYTFKTFKVRR
ncbi:acylphosphatase [Trypanosoma cruzi]|uniref:acylphosphatase n=1 Tax=Trypanosoma cruzi TaxID=5693 RepID=A0A2V2VQG4_TRYCR|nr:putative acylphosphatase [Trypanosoma cruzi]PBJ73837.1 acylphosphatase [Trypanosoma cruzi cruzi]PWU98669.1 putative acylphosphatase [Trypanosoma cruzi]RNF20374.1 acylphosphatase [Trypanosoma cruzi]